MKPIRILWCFAAAALVLGCQDNVTDPIAQADEVAPNLTVEHEEYQVEMTWDDVLAYGCVDELLHVRGIVVVDKYRLWNPVQNPNRKGRTVEFKGLDSEYPEFSMEGMTSGDMWIMDLSKNNKFDEKKHVFKDGSWVYHQDLSWFFINQDGDRLHVKGTYQLMKDMDTAGLKMYQVNRGGCPEIW